MDWQDDELEAFLRQFRLPKPKTLPTPRRTIVLALAVAAVIILAVIIPTRFASRAARPAAVSGITNPEHRAGSDGRQGVPAAPTPQDLSPAVKPDSENRASSPPVVPPPLPTSRTTWQPADEISIERMNSTDGTQGTRRLRVGRGVKAPMKVVDARPIYPDEAKTAGVQGLVIIEIVIATDGSVIQTEVLRSIPELDQAAIDAVVQWEYEPTLLNGEPIELVMTVTINFTLQ